MSPNSGSTNPRAGNRLFDQYLDSPRVEREDMLRHVPQWLDRIADVGMSVTTVANYKVKIEQFSRWLETEQRDFTRRSVALFLDWMQEQGYRPRTIRVAFTAIRSFARYLGELQLETPMLEQMRLPRLDKPQRVSPKPEEVAALFDGAGRFPGHTDLAKYRKRGLLALLAVFAFCGLRAAEAMGLDVSDYESEPRRLRVRVAKGKQSRWVPVNQEAASYLKDWLEIRAELLLRKGKTTKALFTNSKYQRLGEVGLRSLWNELLEVSGLGKSGIVRHSLRHWFASTALEGSDLATVRDLLGHANIQTTATYLHSTEQKMSAATARVAAELVRRNIEQREENDRGRHERRLRRGLRRMAR